MRKERHLMSQVEKILKVKPFGYGANMMERIRDGKSSILTKQRRLLTKDLTRTSDSMSTDHSTLSLDSQ